MTLLAAFVLNALWQDALLVFCIWLLLRAFPRVNAATRYVVWSATLIAAVVVPVVTTYASFVPQRTAAVQAGRAISAHLVRSVEAVPPAGAVPRRKAAIPAQRWLETPDRLRLTIPLNVARAVVAAWALLAAYALIGLSIGLVRLERLKRDALPLPVEYRDAMPQWNRANKGRRAVRLCVSDDIDVPVAVGLFDSMILIPRDLLQRLSPSEVEQISLHELAHLRRGDDWSNCAQRVLVAGLGWNPAALFVAQQLELEREVACDDWVLSSVQSVRPYAMCLTKMAETAAWPHHPMPAPGVFTTRKQISLRIERLLASGRDIATTLSLGPAAAAVAGVAAAAFAIAMVAPTIAAPAIATPPAGMSPPAAAAPIAHPVVRVKTIERVIRVVQVRPVAIATPLRSARILAAGPQHATAVDIASSAESASMKIAQSALAGAQAIAQESMHGAGSSRSCDGCVFEGVNWSGRDLRGANYSGVVFTRANLSGANLSDSQLSDVEFTGANLSGASFRRAHLSGCDLSHTILTGADFSGALISECSFARAALDGARFTGARLVDCDLSGVDRRHIDLSHAQIIDSDP